METPRRDWNVTSGFVKEKLYVGEAIIATLVGIAFSSYGAGIFSPREWAAGRDFNGITLELTRVVIALSVFAVGVELPKAYVLRHWRSLAVLLGPVYDFLSPSPVLSHSTNPLLPTLRMLVGWMVSASLIYGLIPGLDFLSSLVIAAGVTPTDPILAASVVGKGKYAQDHVPAHLRHLLQSESGCNDGAAFPFLYLALFLLMREERGIGFTVGYWVLLILLYQIVLGIVIGAAVGILARKTLKFSKRRKLIDKESMVAMYVALALLVTGLTTLAGSDDLLAAFACGTAFAWDDWFTESIEDSNFSSTVDLLANSAIFLYLGASMPFSAWADASLTLTPWRLVLLAISILALRRIPCIFALQWFIPDIKTKREALFSGHFGPMGVGAIFISTLASTKLPTPNVPPQNSMDILALTIQPITYFIVLSSVLIHGLTIGFFSLGRRVHSRVQSISRTFTQASQAGDEPSWMSRVKRVRSGEQIIINRDDDDDGLALNLAEKGIVIVDGGIGGAEMGDGTPLASILETGAGGSTTPGGTTDVESPGSSSGRAKSLDGEAEGEIVRETEDEHPVHDVVGDRISKDGAAAAGEKEGRTLKRTTTIAEGDEDYEDEGEESSATEERFCKADDTTVWEEGRHIVVEQADGERVEVVDLDPTPQEIAAARSNPNCEILEIHHSQFETEASSSAATGAKGGDALKSVESREKGVVQKFMARRASISAAVNALKPSDGLTTEQREKRKLEKLERDAWCRKEQNFYDKDQGGHRPRRVHEPAREWIQGDQVVISRAGSVLDVRKLMDDEKVDEPPRPLEKLAKLVRTASSPSRASKGKGRERASIDEVAPRGRQPNPSAVDEPISPPRPSNRGLALTRTDRVEVDSDDDDSDEAPPPRPPAIARPAPTLSPARARASSTVRAVRHLLFRGRDPSPERGRKSGGGSGSGSPTEGSTRASSPSRSLRFQARDRPARDGGSGSFGRAFPVVGSGLSIRRTPTIPSSERNPGLQLERTPTVPVDRDIRFADEG